MNKAIVGKKLGMSQVFAQDGSVIPVTVIEAGPCPVVHIKSVEKDGYAALQVAFGETDKINKPQAGVFKKAGVANSRYLKEFKLPERIQARHRGCRSRQDGLDRRSVRGRRQGGRQRRVQRSRLLGRHQEMERAARRFHVPRYRSDPSFGRFYGGELRSEQSL